MFITVILTCIISCSVTLGLLYIFLSRMLTDPIFVQSVFRKIVRKLLDRPTMQDFNAFKKGVESLAESLQHPENFLSR